QHTIAAGEDLGTTQAPIRLPFSWSGITLHATGASALRVRVSPVDDAAASLTMADEAGQPVVAISALQMRELAPGQLDAPRRLDNSIFHVDWVTAAATAPDPDTATWALVGDDTLALGAGIGALSRHRDL